MGELTRRMGPGPLDAGHEGGLRALLQHVAGLGRTHEFGVDHLLHPGAKTRGPLDAARKIRKATPGRRKKSGLVNERSATVHSCDHGVGAIEKRPQKDISYTSKDCLMPYR